MHIEAAGTIEYTSGDLRYKTRVTAKKDGKGYELVEEPYENNGLPNCQGRSAEYFFSHYSSTSYVESQSSAMHVYLFGKEKPIVLVFARK